MLYPPQRPFPIRGEVRARGAASGGPRTASPAAPPSPLTGPIHPKQLSPVSPRAPQRRDSEDARCSPAARPDPTLPPLTSTMAPAKSLRHSSPPTPMEALPAPAPRRTGSDAPPRAGGGLDKGGGTGPTRSSAAGRWLWVRFPRALSERAVGLGGRCSRGTLGGGHPIRRPRRREGCSDGYRPEERNLQLSERHLVLY